MLNILSIDNTERALSFDVCVSIISKLSVRVVSPDDELSDVLSGTVQFLSHFRNTSVLV